ncbi:unnamed protein product [Ranitomeya imitator]|uniref:Uncharacterized protein n=1 Tax=Ranitomeya imitator TaxID=111125 RepID=A0ABN9MJ34_9NEOB|nr:unnamed protein product [Ranitomeya imitator]
MHPGPAMTSREPKIWTSVSLNDIMDLDAAGGSEDSTCETLPRGPQLSHCDQPCLNVLGNPLSASPEQSSEPMKTETTSPTQENVFCDLYCADETLSDDEGAFRGLSALPVENGAVQRARCARCSQNAPKEKGSSSGHLPSGPIDLCCKVQGVIFECKTPDMSLHLTDWRLET